MIQEIDNKTLVATKGSNLCLLLIPLSKWNMSLDNDFLNVMSDGDYGEMMQALHSWSITCPIDNQHRVRIPGELLEWAGIEKKVTIAGVRGKMEIWEPESFKDHLRQIDYDPHDVAKQLFSRI
ncbi:MAG: hypothetical protein HN356_08610 [Calditrichaeota bacterium]|jgi:MraZ protein|nr:hypothetical protein [Calditrichota bacterium]MBT7618339.1 hypothetical protein [Calditrichota bacterium]MBT7790393.1 hypothetical protein [Calditrichota bacterium]